MNSNQEPHFDQVLVIYNPNSTGDSQRKAERFVKRLMRANVANSILAKPTDSQGHAEKLVVQAAAKHQPLFVVSSSGDGGYNEVINGAMQAQDAGKQVVTGLLASGNANDHYNSLHKPNVTKRIKTKQIKQIDLLKLNGLIKGKPFERYAHSYIGFGVSSEIGKALNDTDLNRFNEVIVFLKALAGASPFSAKVDGKEVIFNSILVSNVGKMSKIFGLSKEAKVDDGKFEVTTVEPGMANIIGAMVKSTTTGLPHEKQVRSFTFSTLNELPVQMDGEVFTLDANSKVQIVAAKQVLSCII